MDFKKIENLKTFALGLLVMLTIHYIPEMLEFTAAWDKVAALVITVLVMIGVLILNWEIYSKTNTKLEEIRNEALHHIHVHDLETKYLRNTIKKDLGYERSLEIIKKAKKSIVIIGDYSPENQALDSSKERIDYFKAIENVIEKHVAPQYSEHFKYVRIMQRSDKVYEDLRTKFNGDDVKLNLEDMKGDEDAFSHCYTINKIKQDKPLISRNVEVRLFISRYVPSLPSMLIVDDKHVLFTIPKKNPPLEGNKRLATAGVLHLIDNNFGKGLINPMKEVFDSVRSRSIEITQLPKVDI